MPRRKLSQQQKRRIRARQKERLARAETPESNEDTSGEPGLVVSHHGRLVDVEDEHGGRRSCHFRANLEQLVVGDRVVWRPVAGSGEGVIVALAPRESELRRPDPYGNLKPVAANVDLIVIVFAPLPAPSTVMLDRYLVAAELSGTRPVLLLNKTDLLDDETRPLFDEIRDLYERVGYQVLQASATDGQGLGALRARLVGHTSVLVGQSGVGKSSLVNGLLPGSDLETAEISGGSGLGQHTTTTARLFHLAEGGDLIDSPGIREFGLWHISEDELLRGYPELAEQAAHCRFRNCSHRHEPGCALRRAAEEGLISEERLDNFFHIADTLDTAGRDRYRS